MCFIMFCSVVNFKMKEVVIFTILGVLIVNALAQDENFPPAAQADSRTPDINKIRNRVHQLCGARKIGEPSYLQNRRINWGNVIKSVGQAVAKGIEAYHDYSKGRSAQFDDAEADRSPFPVPYLQNRRINWGNVIKTMGHALLKGIEAYHHYGRSGQVNDAEPGERLLFAHEVGKHVLEHALADPVAIVSLHNGWNDGVNTLPHLRRNNYRWTPPGRPPPYVPPSQD
ncbi:uncharacterized protein [Maniola hyperantus]|uniref:uncharacterized protein n=1 Tax=Aphantopus hyperantus TaxID=2795564 RepID=UPI0037492E82